MCRRVWWIDLCDWHCYNARSRLERFPCAPIACARNGCACKADVGRRCKGVGVEVRHRLFILSVSPALQSSTSRIGAGSISFMALGTTVTVTKTATDDMTASAGAGCGQANLHRNSATPDPAPWVGNWQVTSSTCNQATCCCVSGTASVSGSSTLTITTPIAGMTHGALTHTRTPLCASIPSSFHSCFSQCTRAWLGPQRKRTLACARTHARAYTQRISESCSILGCVAACVFSRFQANVADNLR
jgi:hypothetical protein